MAPRIVIFALERSSFVVIVMFRVSSKVASEVLCGLLLYMVRFERVGFAVSIITFADASFCVTATSSLYIINITIPASPETVSILTDTDYPHLDRIFRAVPIHIGGYTYAITTSNGANGIEIIDITNPSSPTSTASISGNSSMEFGFGINTIHLDGESFLLASLHKSHGVSIINITDPNSPHTLINVFDGSEYNVLRGADGITSVEINDSPYVLVASRGGDGGVQIMQLDHPATTTPLPNLITSSNANSSYARTGDTITVQINANSDINSYHVSILDPAINPTVNHNGSSLNASVNVPFNSALGDATFNITISNSLSSLVVTENDLTSDNVFIGDTSLIANATITSNNANALFAKSNDVISITLYTNVQLHNATLDILGTTVDMTVANNKMAFATVTVLSNAPNGPIMFDITAHDDAHNRFAITENNLTSNSVTIDTSKPNLTNLTIYSNNANTSLATVNNILNITLTADDVIKDATITILGSTYVMDVNGPVANASVNVPQNSAQGEVSFDITAFDLAGNSLTVTQANLNSPNITIDKTAPSVTNLTLHSNNLNSSLARAGDLINITLEASEQIYNATLQIFGTETSMTESNNIAYTTISVLQNSPNGLAAFNITAYDGAGNQFNVTQNDASANVIIDTANPTLSNLTIYSNNPHNTSLATLDDTLNITITTNEDLSSANITILGATYTMSTSGIVANASVTVDASHADGQVEFSITALDLAGNSLTVTQTESKLSNITIDKTASVTA